MKFSVYKKGAGTANIVGKGYDHVIHYAGFNAFSELNEITLIQTVTKSKKFGGQNVIKIKGKDPVKKLGNLIHLLKDLEIELIKEQEELTNN